jgi:protein arginine kinase
VSGGLKIPDELDLGEWLRADGPDHDIALCTRVRFARNVEGYRFSPLLNRDEARNLTAFVTQQLTQLELEAPLRIVDVSGLDARQREILVERHLISRDHANTDRPRCVARDDSERTSIMVNEEDHLRVQVFRSGFRVEEAYAAGEALDDLLISRVPFAFSEEFGFLTACPTNVGTGLRLSVMLHLPGLCWAEEMEKAATTCQKIHLAVRGLYGEGSRALGDFYQVSNQVTLGRPESQLVGDVRAAVQRLIDWERGVRDALLRRDSRARTLDRVYRALGTLQNAWILSSEECLEGLSAVRFGVQQGILRGLTMRDLNRILLLSQPAHLQQLHGRKLDPAERDALRADLVRRVLRADEGEGNLDPRDG